MLLISLSIAFFFFSVVFVVLCECSGIDRLSGQDGSNVEELVSGGSGGKRGDNFAETIQNHFQLLHFNLNKLRTETKGQRTHSRTAAGNWR